MKNHDPILSSSSPHIVENWQLQYHLQRLQLLLHPTLWNWWNEQCVNDLAFRWALPLRAKNIELKMTLQNRSVNHKIHKASPFEEHECSLQMPWQSTYYIMQYLLWKWNFDTMVAQRKGHVIKMDTRSSGEKERQSDFNVLCEQVELLSFQWC